MKTQKLISTVILYIFLIQISTAVSMGSTINTGPQDIESQLARILVFVDDQGMVDYSSLHQDRGLLAEFEDLLSSVPESDYKSWTQDQRISFWINAYNGLTLKAIVDNYPIESSFLTSLRFPKNSIRQISGVWDSIQFGIMGKRLTLDDIEHNILRK